MGSKNKKNVFSLLLLLLLPFLGARKALPFGRPFRWKKKIKRKKEKKKNTKKNKTQRRRDRKANRERRKTKRGRAQSKRSADAPRPRSS